MKTLLVGMGRVGFSGFGTPGIETHYWGLIGHPRTSLVGTVDIDESRRGSVKHYTNIAHALAESKPEVVVVATPPETHVGLCETVADFPSVRGVYCEKPLATTVEGCQTIIDALSGRVLLVGHQRRYELAHVAARNYIGEGYLGPPKAAWGYYHGDPLNNGTHAVDTCRFLAPDAPISLVRTGDNQFRVEIECENGMFALDSYGKLMPGYLHNAYDDLYRCVDFGTRPVCSGEDGLIAVREALKHRQEAA